VSSAWTSRKLSVVIPSIREPAPEKQAEIESVSERFRKVRQ
jgi:hypothetical protein